MDKIAPENGGDADQKLRDAAWKSHVEKQKGCLLTFSQIKNVSSFSKWKKFADCDLKADSTDGLKECPTLLK